MCNFGLIPVLPPIPLHPPPLHQHAPFYSPLSFPPVSLFAHCSFCLSAGTQTGEEIPIVSRSNIKEFKDSFSNENFDFRNSPNITFFVYVSNFTWPIKIQVSFFSGLLLMSMTSIAVFSF